MNLDFPEVEVDNADGNCVIVTTLMSFSDSVSMKPQNSAQSFGKALVMSPAPTTSGWPVQLPAGPAQDPASQLNECARFISLNDEKNNKAIDKANVNVHLNETANANSHMKSYGSGPLGDEGHALLCLDPNSFRGSSAMKRSTRLGPLVVVHRSRDMCGVHCKRLPPISDVEQLSHRRVLEHLRGQLTRAETALEESQAAAKLTARAQTESLESARRTEEERLRKEFHEAFLTVRAENDELTARTKAEVLRSATALTTARDAMESELTSRLDVCERQWRERMRSADEKWETRIETVLREKQEALRHVQDLSHTVGELETALRQATRERTWAEQERDKLAAQQQEQQQQQELQARVGVRSDERAELEVEILTLRASLRDAEVRERALLLQLEAAGDETAVETKALERQLRQVRHELDAERANCGEVVRVYGEQLESMHTQLNDAMRRNAQLTEQMAKFCGDASIK